jgi:hypothetical protein
MKLRAACVMLAASLIPAHAGADSTVYATDIVGKWRSTSNKNEIMTISQSGSTLTLQTSKYKDWDAWVIPADWTAPNPSFQRTATADDIRKLKLDKTNDPPPEQVVDKASEAKITERVTPYFTRSPHFWSGSCDMAMKAIWTGFHLTWLPQDPFTFEQDGSPQRAEKFEQVLYAWPDLRTTTVTVRDIEAPAIGTEVYSYFNERPAMQVYGQFGLAMFNGVMQGVNFAIPVDTALEKLAQSIFTTSAERAFAGQTVTAKDMVKAIAGSALDKTLEAVTAREPLGTVKGAIDNAIGEDQSTAVSGIAQGAAAEKVADSLTGAQATALQQYLGSQCRYEIVKLSGYGATVGGIAVVDKQTGETTIWLVVQPPGGATTAVVGNTTVPEQGTHGSMNILFSQQSH